MERKKNFEFALHRCLSLILSFRKQSVCHHQCFSVLSLFQLSSSHPCVQNDFIRHHTKHTNTKRASERNVILFTERPGRTVSNSQSVEAIKMMGKVMKLSQFFHQPAVLYFHRITIIRYTCGIIIMITMRNEDREHRAALFNFVLHQ